MNHLIKLLFIVSFPFALVACVDCSRADCDLNEVISLQVLEDGNNLLPGLSESEISVNPQVSFIDVDTIQGVVRIAINEGTQTLNLGEEQITLSARGRFESGPCCTVFDLEELMIEGVIRCIGATCEETIIVNL